MNQYYKFNPPSFTFYLCFQSRWLPGSWQRRFHGLVAVCLYVPSLAALVIFLSNLDNALVIGDRIFISGLFYTYFFLLLLIIYILKLMLTLSGDGDGWVSQPLRVWACLGFVQSVTASAKHAYTFINKMYSNWDRITIFSFLPKWS